MGDRFATIDMGRNHMGRKLGGYYAPFRGGSGSHLTQCRLQRPRPTSVPSGILIHPTFWPQYTNIADRQDISPVA